MFKNKSGFSMIELTVVLVIIGIIAYLTARMLPDMVKRADDVKRKAELTTATDSYMEQVRQNSISTTTYGKASEATIPSGSSYTQAVYTNSNKLETTPMIIDNRGDNWGYFVSTAALDNTGCEYNPYGMLTLKICQNSDCTNYRTVENLALITYSNNQDFYSRLVFSSSSTNVTLSYPDTSTVEGNPYSNYLIFVPYVEYLRRLGCPAISEYTQSTTTLPSATSGSDYGPVRVDFGWALSSNNFDQITGYCFEVPSYYSNTESSAIKNNITFELYKDKTATGSQYSFSDNCTKASATWIKYGTSISSLKTENGIMMLSTNTKALPTVVTFQGYYKMYDGTMVTQTFSFPVDQK